MRAPRRSLAIGTCTAVVVLGACGDRAPSNATSHGTSNAAASNASNTAGSNAAGSNASNAAASHASNAASTNRASSSASRGASSGGAGSCLGSSLLASLGKNRLLVGVTTDDTTAAMAPFDIRYIYISGGLFDGSSPCNACDATCTSGGTSCASGCAWWGCYNTPPGMYAKYFIQACQQESPAPTPMFTYYELLQTAEATINGFQEGTAEATTAANNVGIMTRYFADWRFLLQQIGQTPALLHIEPDFWGYARQAGSPTSVAAAVASANPTDCASMPNTIAGMGQCMIAMVRTYAPNAFVGLHASAWNVAGNTDKSVDPTADATSAAQFLAACGASSADFVVVETSDRDAGYYQVVKNQDNWWDPTDGALPDYAQDLAWIKALTESLGVPALYWQTPIGNAMQNNTANHYQDNRVDYFFGGSAAQVESGAPVTVPAHWSDLAAAHVVGVAFGGGEGDQTSASTDGGNLLAKTNAYVSAGGQALCP